MTERQKKAVKIVSEFSDSVNKTGLARILVAENPLLFDGVEQARDVIKYVTGNKGERCRKALKDKSQIKESKNKNIWGLGEEIHNDITPYVIPSVNNKIGVISDIHIPYQSNVATSLALTFLKDKDVNTILINGDAMDFYQASSFIRDPGKRDLQYELDSMRMFVASLRKNFPNALIIYKEGNHEYRWKRFLMLKAPEVFNMSEFRLDIILRLAEHGVIWIDNKKIIKAGKLNIIHGHEYYGSYSPVNPAKGYFNKAMANVMAGHNHQTSSHISKDLNNEITGSWSTGCLCELSPDYMPYNKWNHGFAMVKVDKGGIFSVINKTIINGKLD